MQLTESTFLLYAAKNYENSHCHDVEEFEADLKRIQDNKQQLDLNNSVEFLSHSDGGFLAWHKKFVENNAFTN
jgi:hypothetical protein